MPPIQSPQAQGQNLDKVLVLTKNDLDRITNHLNKRQIEQDIASEEQKRKKDLHEKSLALTRNWNNTIEVNDFLLIKPILWLSYLDLN